jgi:hypothetical protein
VKTENPYIQIQKKKNFSKIYPYFEIIHAPTQVTKKFGLHFCRCDKNGAQNHNSTISSIVIKKYVVFWWGRM